MSDAAAYDALGALEEAARVRGITLARCSFVQLQVGAYEHEKIDVPSREWPDAIRRLVDAETRAWRARNPHQVVVCSRSYSIPRQCVVEIYHAHPSWLSKPAGESVPAAAAPAQSSFDLAPASPRCVPCGE